MVNNKFLKLDFQELDSRTQEKLISILIAVIHWHKTYFVISLLYSCDRMH